MISFTDTAFIFRFLPLFLIVYYLVPAKYRQYVLLFGSLVFYAFGEGFFVILLMALIWVNYLFASYSFRSKLHKGDEYVVRHKKMCLIAGVVLNVAVLAFFKGRAVFLNNAYLPLGLSFYIFKMISFQADVYRGKVPRSAGFGEIATYFSLFPQIAQGPIMRYEEGDFGYEKTFSWERLEDGLRCFVSGLAMKVILADRIGILWNDIKMYGYESISTPLAWLGAFAYSFELYFDFWGYSLMASGIMVALGFDFIENFNDPYASKTVSEFYRRWHMTLGSFFRDYVYFPMGGSRCKKSRMCLNLAIVWILTGIWHGNGLNFIIWGAVLGCFIILEKLLYGKKLTKLPVLGNIYVIFLIPLSWVVFAITDLRELPVYFGRLFPFFGTPSVVNRSDIFNYLYDYWWMFLLCIVLCIPKVTGYLKKHAKSPAATAGLIILFWIAVYFGTTRARNPFMYLHF
ncbi:MAG: MBOAT family protein [Lachnospiraceae bacterium]|nr:MBOAT family protein [Lachnospiraceae bacterium]